MKICLQLWVGLIGGGRKILACKEKFGDYLKALIKIASLQTSFIAMDEALKITNRSTYFLLTIDGMEI